MTALRRITPSYRLVWSVSPYASRSTGHTSLTYGRKRISASRRGYSSKRARSLCHVARFIRRDPDMDSNVLPFSVGSETGHQPDEVSFANRRVTCDPHVQTREHSKTFVSEPSRHINMPVARRCAHVRSALDERLN